MLPRTKTAYDGTPLWLCDHCHSYKRHKELAKRTDEEVVCKLCAAPKEAKADSNLSLGWMIGPKPFNEERVHKVLWRRARPFVVRYRMKSNKDAVNEDAARERTLRRIVGSKPVPDSLREPVFQVLADYDLDPKDNVWLVFRKGVMDKAQMRWLAVECAYQAAQAVSLHEDYPIVNSIFTSLREFVSDPVNRRLSIPRQNAAAVQDDMAKPEYVPQAKRRAVSTIIAACFPNSKDAAVVAFNWAYETFRADDVDGAVALATLNDVVRSLAETTLQQIFAKPELEHWTELEEV